MWPWGKPVSLNPDSNCRTNNKWRKKVLVWRCTKESYIIIVVIKLSSYMFNIYVSKFSVCLQDRNLHLMDDQFIFKKEEMERMLNDRL